MISPPEKKEEMVDELQEVLNDELASSPLSHIDSQNRIWLQILTKERQNYEEKGRLLKQQQEQEITRNETAVVRIVKAAGRSKGKLVGGRKSLRASINQREEKSAVEEEKEREAEEKRKI